MGTGLAVGTTLIQYGQDSFVSPWCKQEELSLKIEGQTLDRIYDGFVGQLTGKDKIDALQRQARKEPQLNRQMAMNGEARAMKQQLAELKKELEKWK